MSKVTRALFGFGTFVIGLSLIFLWPSSPPDTNPTRISEAFWNKYKLQVQFQPYYPRSHFLSIYVFNITNREAVKDGESPVLEQVGPYVYQIKSVKTNITHEEKKDSFLYNENVYYQFRSDLTKGSLTDEIITINLHYLDLVKNNEWDKSVQKFLLSEYPEEGPFHKITVDEFLFNGAKVAFGWDSFYDKSGHFTPPFPDIFGHYFGKNGSNNGIVEVASGTQDPSQIGKILSWRNQTSLTTWDAREYTYCNMINGSDGTIFPPKLNKDMILQFLSIDLRRHLLLKFEREEEMLGVNGYRYTFPRSVVENPSIINKENHECFCLDRDERGKLRNCPIAGHYFEEGSLKVVASLPHFLDGAEQHSDEVTGLSPQREKHESFVVIEPESGILLESHLRVQMNVALESNIFFPKLMHVRNMTLPMYWIDEATEISSSNPILLLMKLKPVENDTLNGTIWLIFNIVGFLMILGGLLNFVREELRKRQHDSTPSAAPSFLIEL